MVMVTSQTLEHMNPQALRELVLSLMSENQEHKQVIAHSQVEIEQQKKSCYIDKPRLINSPMRWPLRSVGNSGSKVSD